MTATLNTLLLDTVAWDLTVDLDGNIAMAAPPYAVAQDAASECRLFLGEAYFAADRGVPYWGQILGLTPPLSLVRYYLTQAAMLVPGVVTAKVFFASFAARMLAGQVTVTDDAGITQTAAF